MDWIRLKQWPMVQRIYCSSKTPTPLSMNATPAQSKPLESRRSGGCWVAGGFIRGIFLGFSCSSGAVGFSTDGRLGAHFGRSIDRRLVHSTGLASDRIFGHSRLLVGAVAFGLWTDVVRDLYFSAHLFCITTTSEGLVWCAVWGVWDCCCWGPASTSAFDLPYVLFARFGQTISERLMSYVTHPMQSITAHGAHFAAGAGNFRC